MKSFIAYIKKNPLPSAVILITLALFILRASYRTQHFQECDSSGVYFAFSDFPRTGIIEQINTFDTKGIIGTSTAEKILDFPVVSKIVSVYAKHMTHAQMVGHLTSLNPFGFARLALVTGISKIPLPPFIRDAFALPLATTYSAGPGFFYGLIGDTSYNAFIAWATLTTLLAFHLGVLLLFFAALRIGINRYAATIMAFLMLFSISMYSYGFNLGSTIWNIASGALWLWLLAGSWGKPNFMRRMSWATAILVFFNYLIIFYWLALLVGYWWMQALAAGKCTMKVAWHEAIAVLKTQTAAIVGIVLVALLFYPPGSGHVGEFPLSDAIGSIPYFILNFFSFYTHSHALNILQAVIGGLLVIAALWYVIRRAKKYEGSTAARIFSLTALWFCIILTLGAITGFIGIIPSRQILFVTPILFLAVALGLDGIIRQWKVKSWISVAIALLLLIVGLVSLPPRIADVQDQTAGITIDPRAQQVVIEDCSYDLAYRSWPTSVPIGLVRDDQLATGTTYEYLSQTSPFDKGATRWHNETGVVTQAISSTITVNERNDIFFIAYNPYHFAHNRQNSLYTALFTVISPPIKAALPTTGTTPTVTQTSTPSL